MGAGNCKSYSIKHDNGRTATESCKETRLEKAEYIEDVVCKENEINENEMKLLPLGNDGGKILLIKQKGELHAIGTKCTHYGALLNTGALGDGRVRCPWHGACFSIKTGDIEDYPGLDSLPCYKVTVNNGEVKVQARKKDLIDNKRVKGVAACRIASQKTAVVVGGGPAGATCAETLRQEGFNGRIIMICKESVLPYDRVKVSKAMDFNIEKSLLRSQAYYDERNIETKLSTEAVALDKNERLVRLNNGENVKYDYVFIATGSKARIPSAAGSDLKNVFVMRNHEDAVATLQQLSPERHVVVLGLSFIAIEAAAYCINKCASVTVIGRGHVPFKAVFGEEIGEKVKTECESKGIKFLTGVNIDKFIGNEDGNLCKVELTNGSVLAADVAIAGIGTTLFTDWLKESGVGMRDDGSVVVDKFLRTNVENVYAGGDIAYAPVFAADDAPAAIGHYPLAHYHGRIAALNICGKETPLRSVPYFWTMLFGKGYRYAGHGSASTIKIHGSLDDLKFFAYYLNNGKVIAMSSVGMDPIVSDFAEYIHEGKILTEKEIEDNPIGWMRNKPVDALKAFFPDKLTSS